MRRKYTGIESMNKTLDELRLINISNYVKKNTVRAVEKMKPKGKEIETGFHRHHLLEIILWPNKDGTFTEIRNSTERLKKLGIYNDFKMTIYVSPSEHSKLHNEHRNVRAKTTEEKEYEKQLIEKRVKERLDNLIIIEKPCFVKSDLKRIETLKLKLENKDDTKKRQELEYLENRVKRYTK